MGDKKHSFEQIKAALPGRKTEPEARNKEERMQQIKQMRERINQHTASQARKVTTISDKTKDFARAQQKQEPVRTPAKEKDKGIDR
jgi:hypothetical protein